MWITRQPSQYGTLIDNIDDYIDITNIDARARDDDELDNIITAAHVTMNKPEDETVEAEIEQRIRELWNMGDRSIYGEAVNNADLRELIRKLDQNKMLTVWWSIRKAEARYMTATDKDQRREYFYSVIYNELKGR